MKLKEVLQKVTENLEVEKDLKNQIKNLEKDVETNKNKLSCMQRELSTGYTSYNDLKLQLIDELNAKVGNIKENLNSSLTAKGSDEIALGLEFRFMGKKYNLISDKHSVISRNESHVLFKDFVAEEMLYRYINYGAEVLNTKNVEKLQEIKELYNKNSNKVSAGFEKLKVSSIVENLEAKNEILKADFANKLVEIEEVECKIEKAKVFKSQLAKKLFSKREKLEEKQAKLLNEADELAKELKEIGMELSDRSEIEKDAKNYVDKEIGSLLSILDIVKDFEVIKFRLFDFKNRNIDYVQMEIEKLSKDLSKKQINLDDLKAMLKMNKKVNKETIVIAFKDKEFEVELDNTDPNNIAKSDQKAYDLLQSKYDQIISAKIKNIM